MRSQTILPLLVASLISGLSASAKPVRSNLHCSLIGSEEQRVIEHNPSRPTIALALGGGGIRGAAAIGALRALERAHIPIDFIAGTSMGAAVGGMYAAGMPLDQIEKLMIARSGLISVMIPTFPIPIATSLPLDSMRIFGIKHAVGIVTGNAVAKMVDKHLTVEQRQIENFKIPFVAIASNVIDGQSYMVNKGDLGKAVQASGSVPMLFQPVATADGKLLIDGGLRANVPAHQARASHADIVIAVNCDDRLKDLSNGDSSTIHGLSNRALSIMLAEIDQHQLEHADLEIIPSTSPISIYSRSRKDAALAIAAGEAATVEMLPSIRAKISAFANRSQLTTNSKQSTKEQTYPVN